MILLYISNYEVIIMKSYMQTDRLEAFYDAIIAIIVTVLVLGLPQPETASLSSFWALKNSYFTYLISFMVCANLWQYHHLIYNDVEKIDTKVIWLNILLMFFVSFIPYLTTYIANNPNSLIPQLLYCFDFISIDFLLFINSRILIDINSNNEENLRISRNALNRRYGSYLPFVIFIVGIVIAFLGYPISISVCCLFVISNSIISSLKF